MATYHPTIWPLQTLTRHRERARKRTLHQLMPRLEWLEDKLAPSAYFAVTGTANTIDASPHGGDGSAASLGTAAPAEVRVNASTPLQITSQPMSQWVSPGQTATFTAAAAPWDPTNGVDSVSWQVSTNQGATYSDIPGATSTTYSFVAALTQSGNLYHAVFATATASATTNPAQLTVGVAPVITQQPTDFWNDANRYPQDPFNSPSVTVTATGPVTVEWDYNPGGGWQQASSIDLGGPTPFPFTVRFPMQQWMLSRDNLQFQAVVSNPAGRVYSNVAVQHLYRAPTWGYIDDGNNNRFTMTVVAGQTATLYGHCFGSFPSTSIPASPTPSVQWLISTDGGETFNNVTDGQTGMVNPTEWYYSFTATPSLDGAIFDVVFTNVGGSQHEGDLTLTVQSPPTITLQPVDYSIAEVGQTVSFTAAASGNPAPTVQWQMNPYPITTGTFTDIPGATSTTYSFTASLPAGMQRTALSGYRAVFTNIAGTATTSTATLIVDAPPVVTIQPVDTTGIASGQFQRPASFTAAASGSWNQVQWQVSTDNGATFSPFAPQGETGGGGSDTMYPGTLPSQDGDMFRAVFSDLYLGQVLASATTAAAKLTVYYPPVITQQPQNMIVAYGGGSVTATAIGNPAPLAQWYKSSDGGYSWTGTVPGIPFRQYTQTWLYRVTFSNLAGSVTSRNATVTIEIPPSTFIMGPSDQTVIAGQTASFNVLESAGSPLTAQWYVNGSPIPGANSSTYSFTASPSQDGNMYWVQFSNDVGSATSRAAKLTVLSAPAIITPPANQTANPGDTVSFTAAASGNPAPSVQWLVSTDNSNSFTDIPGATATTYSFVADASMNGSQYQAVFTNSLGTATTAPATLVVQSATVSTTWGTTGSAVLQTAADGLRLLPAGRNTDLPWMNVNAINITLSSPATLLPGDVSVTGVNVANYGPVTISGSGTNYTITFAQAVSAADRVTISISNAAIAPYVRRLDILPGDVNDDGVVDSRDVVLIRNQIFGFVGAVPTTFGDLNGDGVVDMTDYNLARQRVGTRLP